MATFKSYVRLVLNLTPEDRELLGRVMAERRKTATEVLRDLIREAAEDR